MTTWVVSRHPGAIEWLTARGVQPDITVAHLDISRIQPGDIVVGSLPVNLAAEVCSCGAHYLHLSLRLPAEWRGRELSAAELDEVGAEIREYRVLPV